MGRKSDWNIDGRGPWKEILHDFAQRLRAENSRVERPVRLLDWANAFLSPHFPLPPSAMHCWAADRLDEASNRRGMKINILAPRGSAKSTLGTFAFPLREALEGRQRYIWIISDTKSQALTHLENIRREIEENELLRRAYPNELTRPRFRSNGIFLASGVAIESYGTGQRLRGRRLRQFRPTLIVCDDIQNDDHIVSETRRSRSRTWFHGTLLKAGTVSTNVVHLATALHPEAIALELLKTPGWTGRVFKAILRWPDRTDLWEEWERILSDVESPDAESRAAEFYRKRFDAMNEGAEVLWPESESLVDLMKMRLEGGEKTFLREKQNSPINPEHCEFNEIYFTGDLWFDRWPDSIALKTLALDPSKGKDARSGDYSAFILAAVTENGTFYIDAEIARLPLHDVVETAIELYRRWQPDLFGVEINQFQELLKDQLARRLIEEGMVGVEPYPIHNTVNKIVRIRRLGPLLAARRVRFRRGNPSITLLVEQLKAFPVGDHDDGPDAMEMAIRLAEEIRRTPESADSLGNRIRVD